MKNIFFLAIAVLLASGCTNKQTNPLPLVPYPSHLKTGKGSFALQPTTQILVNDQGKFTREVHFFQSLMSKTLGHSLSREKGHNQIEIVQSDTFSVPESYAIEISPKKITLAAGDAAGIFYAIETIRQLLPTEMELGKAVPEAVLPSLVIFDTPLYNWRGMHLDVSRHFFSLAYLKRYVDLLALYKMNKLHLHLTDDQGWRLEIKKYPELTQKGAWRTFNNQDSVCMQMAMDDSMYALDEKHLKELNGQTLYGGFYTQEQIRELVAYAGERHVEIIPEIDMPGHMMAAIQIYPYLSCSGKAEWGNVFSTPLCPVEERVYSFVEDVLNEVTALFPSKYVHIGADVVEKTSWEASEACQQFMQQQGYTDIKQLQGYFVNRITRYLQAKGKEVMVWDDALEGGIDSTLHVMYWRNWVGGVPERAAQNGNRLIMVPGNPLYFSRISTNLFDIYNLKITGPKFPAERTDQIMGLQACVWSETVPNEQVADALIFPKITALAERCWSDERVLDWDSFKQRLMPQLDRLGHLGVNYFYKPSSELLTFMEVDTVQKRIGIIFESEISNPAIYYTTDGSVPTTASNLYKGKFYVDGSASICAAVFKEGMPTEPILRKPVDYHKAIGKPVTYHKPWNNAYPAGDAGALTDGLRGGTSYGDGKWQGFTNDVDVTIDLGTVVELHSFSATFMQIIGPGVFMPEYVKVSVSTDGERFQEVLNVANDVPQDKKELVFKDFSGPMKGEKARFVRVVAHNAGQAFLFVDEVVLK